MISVAIPSSITTYLGPLISVAVGWLLHEISDAIKARREDRIAVGEVLAELLEIHRHWRYLPAYLAEIKKMFAPPPEIELLLRTTIDQILSPILERMEGRYNEAIDSIKGRLPLLAFQLRGKEALRQAFDQLRSLAESDPKATAALPTVKSALTEKALPGLEMLLLKLAWIHGFRTWLGVRRLLRKKEDIPSEVKELLDSLLKAAGVPPPPVVTPSS
jgi:hypothetical protein